MSGPVLRDIHLPPEPGLWPWPPGWWLVLVLGVAVAAFLVAAGLRAHRRSRQRRWLRAAVAAAGAAHNPATRLANLSSLLRRATRAVSPTHAALEGEAWLRWLDGQDPRRGFSTGPGRLLLDDAYRASPKVDPTALAALERLVEARLRTLLEGRHA